MISVGKQFTIPYLNQWLDLMVTPVMWESKNRRIAVQAIPSKTLAQENNNKNNKKTPQKFCSGALARLSLRR
jgi:hypothetical protein